MEFLMPVEQADEGTDKIIHAKRSETDDEKH
jgi:hypothetical protein